METIRMLTEDGAWIPHECEVRELKNGTALIFVPRLNGLWWIAPEGMFMNTGGDDWRIYDLHPEDCARLCKGGVA